MKKIYLFDWGGTIMREFPNETGPMVGWTRVEIMPHADEMLRALSKKADCYLATNARDSTKEEIAGALRRVGLDEYFKDIFCFRELGSAKPSSDYFDKICSKLGVDKSSIIMVGDHLQQDVIGVMEQGIKAILYDPGGRHPDYEGTRVSDLRMVAEMS